MNEERLVAYNKVKKMIMNRRDKMSDKIIQTVDNPALALVATGATQIILNEVIADIDNLIMEELSENSR